jgi:hypothetical protein
MWNFDFAIHFVRNYRNNTERGKSFYIKKNGYRMSERYSENRLVGEFCELMGLDGETQDAIMKDETKRKNAVELMLLYYCESNKEGVLK